MSDNKIRFYRPTFAEINLGSARKNLKTVRSLIGETTKVLAVVKADAYGHGVERIARVFDEEGVEFFGVASLDEAGNLRRLGIKKPILVLGQILPEEAEGVFKFNVIQAVSDLEIVRRLNRIAERKNKTSLIHIKVDTGMGRLGFWHKEAIRFIREINKLKNVFIDGIFTHFPSADEDSDFTNQQIQDFRTLIRELKREGIDIPNKHIANSMAVIGFKDSHMNLVRPGLMLYGIYPKEGLKIDLRLEPVMSLQTKIIFLKEVPPGRSISYGRTHITKKPTKIATIPVGYGDGYLRGLSNKAWVLIRGRRAPIIGRICMDLSMVDVGGIPEIKIGDEVVLIGRQGKEAISAEELASLCNTIPYEIVCSIGRRVPRVYLK